MRIKMLKTFEGYMAGEEYDLPEAEAKRVLENAVAFNNEDEPASVLQAIRDELEREATANHNIRDRITQRRAIEIFTKHLNSLTVEDVARLICDTDKTAPDPDANIMLGLREAKAWEARIPQATAIIKLLRG
jgi:23S rRNA A2030 N6-methylase RlmJ